MSIRIKIGHNVEQVRASLALTSPAVRRHVVRGLHEIGAILTGRFKTVSPRFSGHLANAHDRAVDENALILTLFNRARHAAWLHDGTTHTRMPPPAALERWAARKLGDPKLAFLVARAILRRGGLKALRWMEKEAEAYEPNVRARLQAAVDQALGEVNG